MRRILLAVCCCVVLAGCGNTGEKFTTFYTTYDEEKATKLEEILNNESNIDHANVIFVEDRLLVAMQVKPWMRYKKQKIEEAIKEKLEKEFPKLQITVSTDFKLHWESAKLIDKNEEEGLSDKIEKLDKLSKEET
ncbi:YhcN/YlaJ family sporulation lipoprotein [Lysinibacillus sp. LZ02]|uniref:YhcN/YlaJ family sporulation lipoprotein n=1 Tax=Lysinibacillus sp. LZ02 TaxID=3420668 RepID=UPI003D3624B5